MVGMEMKVTGPLFGKNAHPILKRHIEGGVGDLADAGHQKLNQTLRPGPGGVYLSVAVARRGHGSTGNYRRNINATHRGLNARIDDGGVIYGPWLEGISTRNQTTRFKGYAAFRTVAQWLQQQVHGVFRARMVRAMRELNG